MKHITIALITLHLSLLTLFAAVPLRWTVETSSANPATFDQFAGATYDLEAALQSRGKPLAVTGDPKLYWQTNGMGTAWWSAPATVSGNVLRATWTPACDVGAKVYNCFIGITGTVYNAAFQLRLRPSPGALPNALPLPQKVIDFSQVTVLNPPWPSGSARPLPKYLHEIDFSDSYPDDAAAYYRSRGNGKVDGGCSAVRDGGCLYRNFDFPLDERAEFVVKMSAGPGRFASVGIAQVGTNLTEQMVTSGKPSRWYKSLPGATTDGINENGVVAEVNVVDVDPQWRSGVLTASDIHPLAAVRWVLDNATSAGMAASNLVARIMFPSRWKQNFHWMLADSEQTWIVENGTCSNVTGRAVMTNFPLIDRIDGMGLERYNLLVGGESITNAWFTRAYSRSTNWESEFKDAEEMESAKSAWETYGREELRGKGLWQTVHCSIYDIANRTLRIAVQEQDDWYTFQVPTTAGGSSVVDTNTVKGIISNTVDKAYVESLGISGGGGGGTNTNDVKAIVDAEVGGTNEVKEAVSTIPHLVSATNEMTRSNTLKRDKTDYECYDFGQWSTTPALEPGFEIRQDEHSDGFVIFDHSLGIVSTVKGDSNSISLKWGENEWTRGYEIEATRTAIRTNTLVLARRSRHASSSLAKFDEYGNLVEASPVAPSSAAEQGQAADAKATGEALDAVRTSANDANVWSMATYNFMTGGRTNCWFSGTNYVFGADAATRTRFAWEDGMDAATVPCSMALWEIRDGVRQLVWDQKDWPTWYWSFKAKQMAADIQGRIDALGNAVTNAANYAWSKRYASDGTPNPDASTTFIDTPSVTLSPGMKWETVATVSGAAYWTIVGNGAVIGGSGTNATLRIQDFEGNDIMTITKGEHRLAWLESGDITGNMYDGDGWICFDMLADAEPVGYFSTTLDTSDFLPQTDPNCPAQYSWENIGGGKWRVHFLLKPGIQSDTCFAKFQVEVEGQTVIRYNAGQEISGGLIYNGVKIAPDVSGSPAVGTVIQWKVVR